MTAVVEVDWHTQDQEGYPYYRRCDFCERGADDDAIAGLHADDFRQFFVVYGGPDDGLNVCGCCLEEYLKGLLE